MSMQLNPLFVKPARNPSSAQSMDLTAVNHQLNAFVAQQDPFGPEALRGRASPSGQLSLALSRSTSFSLTQTPPCAARSCIPSPGQPPQQRVSSKAYQVGVASASAGFSVDLLRERLALLEFGNTLYYNNPADPTAPAGFWLSAGAGGPQLRSALSGVVNNALHHRHAGTDVAVDLLHWAWLTPLVARGLSAFRAAVAQDSRLAATMEAMLVRAEDPATDPSLRDHLKHSFAPLVGDIAREQTLLMDALRQGNFVQANLLAKQLQKNNSSLFVAHWARFVCAAELGGHTRPGSSFLDEQAAHVFCARGIVSTFKRCDGAWQARLQGPLSVEDYRQVWTMFLDRYWAIAPNDFVALPAFAAVAVQQGRDARCLEGLFWSDLVAVPFPRTWDLHAADLQQRYVHPAFLAIVPPA